MTPKRPLTVSKKDPFSYKKAYFDPFPRFSRIAFSLKKATLFSRFSGHACLQHLYSSGPTGLVLSTGGCNIGMGLYGIESLGVRLFKSYTLKFV